MSDSRIKLDMSAGDMILKMSEGNPGAATTLMEMLKEGGKIDPDSAFAGFTGIINLDSFGIYGTNIYILYSDICGRDVLKTLAVLRAVQLGLFNREILREACSRQDYSGKSLVPVDELLVMVQKELPNFGK